MARKTKTPAPPATTSQRLASLVKSCRDIMRKDRGLNGDLDRLPHLTWIMFLKFLDDLEQQDEAKAKLAGERYSPLIPAPYRWRDWAAKPDGITGPELLAFVNQDEAVLPNGKRGLGLFAKLKSLSGSDGADRRGVIARVFSGTTNRMIQGYLLRDVINKVNELHFSSSDELHTLGALYEGMLQEMRDAAGDSGEFYTPRPVVKFMVAVTDPRLGETVLDPACGTGGFLVEAYEHLKRQVKTTKDRELLQRRTLFGGEAKPLPYLLAEMNLLLHGVQVPNIEYGNSLAVKLGEIGDKDRVHVILTNPPFGGEEEAAIKGGFPIDTQTSETALLFLQLIMRKLRRARGGQQGGRAAVVVPNGVLSASGVAKRVREQLLREFDLHTVVRLPHNVFAPYTDIPTNLLFFRQGGPTRQILYCDVPPPPGAPLSKTKPMTVEHLAPFVRLTSTREQSEHSWVVDADTLDESLNLDIKNPRTKLKGVGPPAELVAGLARSIDEIAASLSELRPHVDRLMSRPGEYVRRPLGDLTAECDERIGSAYDSSTRLVGVTNEGGISPPKTKIGRNPAKYKVVRRGYLAYNPMRINIGSIGVARGDEETGVTSPDYVVFRCLEGAVPEYVYHYLKSDVGRAAIRMQTKGSVRSRLYYEGLSKILIPLPPSVAVQLEIVSLLDRIDQLGPVLDRAAAASRGALEALRRAIFGEPAR